jgi:hypothetical protein
MYFDLANDAFSLKIEWTLLLLFVALLWATSDFLSTWHFWDLLEIFEKIAMLQVALLETIWRVGPVGWSVIAAFWIWALLAAARAVTRYHVPWAVSQALASLVVCIPLFASTGLEMSQRFFLVLYLLPALLFLSASVLYLLEHWLEKISQEKEMRISLPNNQPTPGVVSECLREGTRWLFRVTGVLVGVLSILLCVLPVSWYFGLKLLDFGPGMNLFSARARAVYLAEMTLRPQGFLFDENYHEVFEASALFVFYVVQPLRKWMLESTRLRFCPAVDV